MCLKYSSLMPSVTLLVTIQEQEQTFIRLFPQSLLAHLQAFSSFFYVHNIQRFGKFIYSNKIMFCFLQCPNTS